jgi:hypothetical protein
MIRSPNANSPEDEFEQFTLRVREDGEDILKTNIVKDRVKPLPSRNPKTRIPNRMVPGEGAVWIKRLTIVENVMDVLVGLNPLHLEQTVREAKQVVLSTLRSKQRLPEVTDFALGRVEDAFNSFEVLQC